MIQNLPWSLKHQPRSRDSLLIYEFRACSHDPEITHCPGATHWLQGQLCLSARSDVCNCSHDFFVAMGQLREAGCLTPGKGRFPLGGIFRGDIVFVFWRPLSANWSSNKRKCRSAENSALWKMPLKASSHFDFYAWAASDGQNSKESLPSGELRAFFNV